MEDYLWNVATDTNLMPRAPRFLIARFSALGDVVMMQPVVTALRNAYGEDAQIDLICLTRSLPAATLISGINELHVVERGTGEILHELKAKHYDYLLDLHGTVRSRSLSRGLDVLTLSVDKQAWARLGLIHGWRNRAVVPFVDRCLDVLRPFGVEGPSEQASGPKAWGELRLPESPALAEETVLIGLGSSHPGKHVSDAVLDATIQSAHAQGLEVVLVGGEAEKARASTVVARHPQVKSQVGSWDLGQTAFAIAQSRAVVTGDTVTLHLAAASGTPCAAVWGCTRPSLGLAAWRPNPQSIDILPKRHSPLRPCSKHGAACRHTRSSDPLHPDRCGQQVDAHEVSVWLQNLLV